MVTKTHGIPHKPPHKVPHYEPREPAPIEPTPVQQPLATPTKPSRADVLEAAINEIADVVGTAYPISRRVQDIIAKEKTD
jgi:hypothetical protein